MDGTIAESYLRRCGEDNLRDERGVEDETFGGGLYERARALVLAGLLDTETARKIVTSYGQARLLRGFGGWFAPEPRLSTPAPAAPRVCGFDATINVGATTIIPRYVSLGQQRTRVCVTMTFDASAAPAVQPGARFHPHHHMAPPNLQLRDDAGRSVTAHFSGGGGQDEWNGSYDIEPGLSRDTVWLEINGTRRDLTERAPGYTADVEQLVEPDAPVEARALRFLEHTVEVQDPRNDGDGRMDAAAAAFAACGVLGAEGQALIDRTMHGAMPTAFPSYGPRRKPLGTQRTKRTTVVIGATLPDLEGVTFTVNALCLEPDFVTVDLEAVGAFEFDHARNFPIDAPRINLVLKDDAGNTHIGWPESFSHGESGLWGSMRFEGPLDPKATSLDLVLTAETTRAVLRIPLPAAEAS